MEFSPIVNMNIITLVRWSGFVPTVNWGRNKIRKTWYERLVSDRQWKRNYTRQKKTGKIINSHVSFMFIHIGVYILTNNQ